MAPNAISIRNSPYILFSTEYSKIWCRYFTQQKKCSLRLLLYPKMANEMIDTWVCRKICKMEPNLLLKQQKMLESHSLLAQRFVRDANAKGYIRHISEILFTCSYDRYTHATNNFPIAAIAYFINILDSQSSGHVRGRPYYLKVWDFFYKI